MSRNKREGKFAGKFLGIRFRMGVDAVWSYIGFKPCRYEAKCRNCRRIWMNYKFKDKNVAK